MLAWWFELLPLFVVRWAARGCCERIVGAGGARLATARPDVLFVVEKAC